MNSITLPAVTLHVYYMPGRDPTYLGRASSMEEAERMAESHFAGKLEGVEAYQWESNRAAGGRALYPPRESELTPEIYMDQWFGPDGWYCALTPKKEEVAS